MYSWKLTPADKVPAGKHDDISLREKIKQIQKDLNSNIKPSDAKQWLIKMQQLDGRGYSSIHTIRGVVRPAFQMAVDDDLIIKNPFEFQLNTVVVNDSVTRDAITRKQERDFLEFVKNDKHFCKYYDGIFILFKTGLCISEFVGLTKSNLDFENNRIIVDHQLQRTRSMKYVMEDTKTETKSTRLRCQRLHLMCADTPFVVIWQSQE